MERQFAFGKNLKAAREAKGLTFDAIVQITKISVPVLRNIEKEAHEKLPNPAYVKGFIRLYADAVALDPEQAVMDYIANRNAYEKAAAMAARSSGIRGRFWTNMLLSLGALICLIALTIYLISDVDKSESAGRAFQIPPASSRSSLPEQNSNLLSSNQPDRAADASPAPIAAEPPKKPDKYRLSVVTVESTWMKVITDGSAPKQYMLNPGDQMELEANSGFSLLIGNAVGLQLKLNDDPVTIRGSKGQVVTLQLP